MRPEFSTEELPLAIGVVRGIRTWSTSALVCSNREPDGVLRGMRNWHWRPGENVAQCLARVDWTHLYSSQRGLLDVDLAANPCRGIEVTCECGFYAYWADRYVQSILSVAGVIEGYGRTVIGPRGFRCEKARILALAPRYDDVRLPMGLLGDRYRVPTFETVDDMLAEFPPDDASEVVGRG